MLRSVVEASGYEVVVATGNWIPKELTLIARKSDHEPPTPVIGVISDNIAGVQHRLDWVVTLGQQTHLLAAQHTLGIFGTSIAATWLQEELQGAAAFLWMKTRAVLDRHSWVGRFCNLTTSRLAIM